MLINKVIKKRTVLLKKTKQHHHQIQLINMNKIGFTSKPKQNNDKS